MEIIFKKPDKPYKAVGSVVFRKFSGEHSLKIDHKELKEELFSRKIDGVWIPDKIEKLEGIPSLVVRTENQDGMILSLAESNLDIEKLTGIAFRYRNAGKESKSIR